MKVMIIGYSGSGKSTLCRKIADVYQIEPLFMDTIHWLPGWKERDRDEEISLLKDFLSKNESWVIDGNYSKVLHKERCELADRIIFMDFNRFSCLKRALKRGKEYRFRTRESMTEGCPEKIDMEFVQWILYKGRSREIKDRYRDICSSFNGKCIIIRNQKQLDELYERIDGGLL